MGVYADLLPECCFRPEFQPQLPTPKQGLPPPLLGRPGLGCPGGRTALAPRGCRFPGESGAHPQSVNEAGTRRPAPGEASAPLQSPESVSQELAAAPDSAPHSSVRFPQTRGGRSDTKGARCARALAGGQHPFHDLASHPQTPRSQQDDVCRARGRGALGHPKISGPPTTCGKQAEQRALPSRPSPPPEGTRLRPGLTNGHLGGWPAGWGQRSQDSAPPPHPARLSSGRLPPGPGSCVCRAVTITG